eukprot:TRINITY_DN839_c0_g2_i1.p1 TRINITY_DN839_c0_g2~~TRINITY_DN839_c0_g2_i1.p1  ORF type:complete len:272 (-),score=31.06 TRINITY_DN839_c0_g2_i1:27-842(-)
MQDKLEADNDLFMGSARHGLGSLGGSMGSPRSDVQSRNAEEGSTTSSTRNPRMEAFPELGALNPEAAEFKPNYVPMNQPTVAEDQPPARRTVHDTVDYWLNNQPESTLMFSTAAVEIRVKDLRTLRPGQKLNDEVMNFHIEDVQLKSAVNSIFFLNTFFYTRLWSSGVCDYDAVRKWTKESRLQRCCGVSTVFDLNKLIFPVHENDHWTLVVLDFTEETITHYDSLRDSDRSERILNRTLQWVDMEWQHKEKVGDRNAMQPRWRLKNWPLV